MSNRVNVTIDGVDYQVEESALLGHVSARCKECTISKISQGWRATRALLWYGRMFRLSGKHRRPFRCSSLLAAGA